MDGWLCFKFIGDVVIVFRYLLNEKDRGFCLYGIDIYFCLWCFVRFLKYGNGVEGG